MKDFDYYIFIDYSENFLGYMIVEENKIDSLVSKTSKFAHYKKLKHKKSYIHSIKKIIEKNNLFIYILKHKIKKTINTPEIYSDILEFIKKHDNCIIFISIDDMQYINFQKLVNIIDGQNIKVVKESNLRKDGKEYRMSLVLDTLLNIERLKEK